jgi:hypothetical protein
LSDLADQHHRWRRRFISSLESLLEDFWQPSLMDNRALLADHRAASSQMLEITSSITVITGAG